jgi:3-oxoacyl-[acyl-carrier protein] reductase
MKLHNKVALITGAASGIGRAEALLFAREGAAVAVTDINLGAAEKVAAEITADGGDAAAFELNAADKTAVETAAAAALRRFGRIDVLGYTAGMFDGGSPTLDTSEQQWDRVFAVNVKGLYLVTNALLPQMLDRGSGAIVIVASNAGLIGGGGGAAYTASKHAAIGYGRQLAANYGPRGIRTNMIAPGLIDTPMAAQVMADPAMTEIVKRMPAGRPGQPEEIAAAALFLASDDASYVYAMTVSVDGGHLNTVG